MRVASHLARWGVKARTPEAKAAAVMFPFYEDLETYIKFAHSSGVSGALFVSQFGTESDDGYVGLRNSETGFSVVDDLTVAHRLGVTQKNKALYAAIVEELTRKHLRAKGGFSLRPGELEASWDVLLELGNETVLALIMKNIPLMDTSVQYALRQFLREGVSQDYLTGLDIFFTAGNMHPEDYTVQEVINFSRAGVPVAYVAPLAKLSLGETGDTAIRFYQAGVPAEYVVICITAGLNIRETLASWADGVAAEYVTAIGAA